MLCLSVACLFFKSYNLQYRQQCIFWELIFPKSHNPESKLHKKWKLRFFHQKGNLMLCNLEEKHKTEIYPNYSEDNLLTTTPPILKASCISEELWLTLGSLHQRRPPKSIWRNTPLQSFCRICIPSWYDTVKKEIWSLPSCQVVKFSSELTLL